MVLIASSSTSARAISSSGSTRSTAPSSMAARGIPNTALVASSCAIVGAPAALRARIPSAPSRPMPVRMTPQARGPYSRAAERKSGVTDGRKVSTGGASESRATPSRTTRWRPVGASRPAPGRSGSPSARLAHVEARLRGEPRREPLGEPVGDVLHDRDRRREARGEAAQERRERARAAERRADRRRGPRGPPGAAGPRAARAARAGGGSPSRPRGGAAASAAPRP